MIGTKNSEGDLVVMDIESFAHHLVNAEIAGGVVGS